MVRASGNAASVSSVGTVSGVTPAPDRSGHHPDRTLDGGEPGDSAARRSLGRDSGPHGDASCGRSRPMTRLRSFRECSGCVGCACYTVTSANRCGDHSGLPRAANVASNNSSCTGTNSKCLMSRLQEISHGGGIENNINYFCASAADRKSVYSVVRYTAVAFGRANLPANK